MTTLLFVHGMNGTARNWHDIPERLKAYADDSLAVQLPGHDGPNLIKAFFLKLTGRIDTPLEMTYESKQTMDTYVQEVSSHFPDGSGRDVVLIGHSMGGAVISHVATKYPDRIAKLIYMAAMLPDENDSAASLLSWIKNSGEINTMEFALDFLPHLLKLEAVSQPKEPLESKFNRTVDFNAIPKAYIRCADDDVIPATLQDEMLRNYPTAEVKPLDLSHFPQFDDPERLASTIQKLLPP